MKRLLIILIMLAAGFAARPQSITTIRYSQDIYLLNNLDIAALHAAGITDTCYYFRLFKEPQTSWSMQHIWTGFADAGTADSSYVTLEVSNLAARGNYLPYYNSPTTVLTTGSGTDAWEDQLWAWAFFRLRLHLDTATTGHLTSIINLN